MLGVAVANGTTDIVLTPHYLVHDMRSYGYPKDVLTSRFESFREAASQKYPSLKLYLGAETFGVNNIEDFIEDGKMLPINGTKYILLEFAFDDRPARALEVVKSVMNSGYYVIIAHPERYDFIQSNPRLIVPFLEAGAVLQINATSVTGQAGFAARDVALSFLENRLASIVASDCHSLFQRSPDMSEAYSYISSELSPEYAEDLFNNNPVLVLKGRRI